MELADGNILEGIFNHDTIPLGAVYTPGDLSIFNSVIYRCIKRTPTDPGGEEWEIYLNGVKPAKTIEEISEGGTSLVSSSALRDYLQSSFPGTNSDGSLKSVPSDLKLSELPLNSAYFISSEELEFRYTEGEIPVKGALNNSDSVGIIKTYGYLTSEITDIIDESGLNTGEVSDPESNTSYRDYRRVQELMEVLGTGQIKKYYRSIESSTSFTGWTAEVFGDQNQDLFDYITLNITKLEKAKSAYETFISQVTQGSYKLFKQVLPSAVSSANLTSEGGETMDFTKFTRIYIRYQLETNGPTYSSSIDITPEDRFHIFGNEESATPTRGELVYEQFTKGSDELKLVYSSGNSASGVLSLVVPGHITLVSAIESDTFII